MIAPLLATSTAICEAREPLVTPLTEGLLAPVLRPLLELVGVILQF